ncbi:MAG: hypothetical protein EXS67_03120 [Candidatus Margulisbacteria bacterium]|nr:hypothetical protein [Candidatus Margulisiibacteriota bacterium]
MINLFYLLFFSALFRLSLDVGYVWTSKFFAYVGIVNNPHNYLEYVLSYVLIFILALFVSINKPFKPSQFVFILLFIFAYIPATCVFANNKEFLLPSILKMTVCMMLIGASTRFNIVPVISLKQLKYSKTYLVVCLFFFTTITLFLIVKTYGITTKIPSLSGQEIYALRDDFAVKTSRGIAYFLGWQANVICVVILAIGMLRKKPLWIIFALIIQIFLFATAGMKSHIFTPPIFMICYFGLRKFYKNFTFYLLGVFTVFMVLIPVAVESQYNLPPIMTTFSVRRTFLVPSQLYFYYYSFFLEHPYDYFSSHFPIKLFSKSNYKKDIPGEIGWEFYRERKAHANASMFADGFSDAGFIGMLINTLLLCLWLGAIDCLAKNKEKELVAGTILMPTLALNSTGLISAIIGNGFVVSLLIIYLLPCVPETMESNKLI